MIDNAAIQPDAAPGAYHVGQLSVSKLGRRPPEDGRLTTCLPSWLGFRVICNELACRAGDGHFVTMTPAISGQLYPHPPVHVRYRRCGTTPPRLVLSVDEHPRPSGSGLGPRPAGPDRTKSFLISEASPELVMWHPWMPLPAVGICRTYAARPWFAYAWHILRTICTPYVSSIWCVGTVRVDSSNAPSWQNSCA